MKKVKPIWSGGNMHPTSPNKVFCTAPWTHTYISPQSERRMCCASREEHTFQKQYIDASNDERYGEVRDSGTIDDYKPVSLKEHWNSPYMMDIRKKLMAGESIPQCDVCNESILSQSTYRQWFTGFLFEKYIDKCFEETDENGYTTMEPIGFDYPVSNLCNFKCPCVVNNYLAHGRQKKDNMVIGRLRTNRLWFRRTKRLSRSFKKK